MIRKSNFPFLEFNPKISEFRDDVYYSLFELNRQV